MLRTIDYFCIMMIVSTNLLMLAGTFHMLRRRLRSACTVNAIVRGKRCGLQAGLPEYCVLFEIAGQPLLLRTSEEEYRHLQTDQQGRLIYYANSLIDFSTGSF